MTAFEKMSDEELRVIEVGLLDTIKGLIMVRRVEHTKYKTHEVLPSGRVITGYTTVKLYPGVESDWPFENVCPCAVGVTKCSESESGFRKIIGRIRATGRALREYKKFQKKQHKKKMALLEKKGAK